MEKETVIAVLKRFQHTVYFLADTTQIRAASSNNLYQKRTKRKEERENRLSSQVYGLGARRIEIQDECVTSPTKFIHTDYTRVLNNKRKKDRGVI